MTISQTNSTLTLPDTLTQRTAFLLQMAVVRVQAMGEIALADTGVNGREYGVLAVLEGGVHATQRQIGTALGIDRTTVTALLRALEQRGMIRRVPDPRDRRANSVTLTPDGDRHRSAAAIVLEECENRYLRPLDDVERVALHATLLRLTSDT